MSKIIGIVGGVGPKAGENLHAKILLNTRAVRDGDHLPILLYTNPAIPDRTDFILGKSPENPGHEILRSLELLVSAGARVLCIPCNTAHAPVIWDVVKAGLAALVCDAQLLHIVNLTVEHMVHHYPNVSRVGILATTGTILAEVYQVALVQHGIFSVVPSESHQREIHDAIYHPEWGIKARSAPVMPHAIDILTSAAARLVAGGAEAIILGCTEIPLALTEPELGNAVLIDASNILARKAIQRAAGEEKLVPDT